MPVNFRIPRQLTCMAANGPGAGLDSGPLAPRSATRGRQDAQCLAAFALPENAYSGFAGALPELCSPGACSSGAGFAASCLRLRFSSFFAFLARSRWRFANA